jgi:carboxypeptidase family protein
MRVLVVLFLLAASACTSATPVTPTDGTWSFSGTVSGRDGDRVGAPIPNAELTVIDGVNLNAKVRSDAAGRYAFDALESGRFTVSIQAPGYVSATPVVNLYRDTEVNFALARQ